MKASTRECAKYRSNDVTDELQPSDGIFLFHSLLVLKIGRAAIA